MSHHHHRHCRRSRSFFSTDIFGIAPAIFLPFLFTNNRRNINIININTRKKRTTDDFD